MRTRKPNRLQGYDYALEGLYFVTICTQNKECLFGNITDGEMFLNEAGRIAQDCWFNIPQHFPNTVLHEFIVMPNHIHGIIEIAPSVGANNHSPENNTIDDFNGGKYSATTNALSSKTLGSVIRGFKIGVTKWFGHPIWQRSFYDHIIRNNQSYLKIAEYILTNPERWPDDELYTSGSEF